MLTPTAKGQKRHRMADERDGKVAVLCFACRRSTDTTKQASLAGFFRKSTEAVSQQLSEDAPAATDGGVGALQCSRCRRVMEQRVPNRNADPSAPSAAAGSKSRVLPQIARLRQYQRIASEQGIPFCVAEHQATAMMREACALCGAAAPEEGHGLTRLRIWPEGMAPPSKGGFMGPFHPDNLATACGTCNLMKGARRIRGYVEACRHIATHRGGHDYGRYPHRFRNNTSKRSRSSYVTASSTHSKTHALSNESFNAITSRPCHYCGKESDPPRHHNGLDRLDSSLRVYTEESAVSCCGDCNVMKYTYSEADFLAHVQRVADANTGQVSFVGDVEGEEADADDPAPSRWAFERGEGAGGGDEGEGGRGEGEGGGGGGGEAGGAARIMLAWDENSDEEEAGMGEQGLEQPAPNPFAAFEFGGAK